MTIFTELRNDALDELRRRARVPALECTWRATSDASEGRKDDSGKDPWHLLPWDAVRAIVKVLAFGTDKYTPRNWERGMAWSRPYAGLMRHMTAWWEGEGADPETGYSHL
jgi:hypothetical protein